MTMRTAPSKRNPTPRTVCTQRGSRLAELPAQPADVHVQRLGGPEPVLVPDARDQVLAGDDLAGVPDQLGEQVELLARERELVAVQEGPARAQLDPERADHDVRRRGRLHAAQDGPHPRDHLRPAERLDHVVVGAELEPDDPLELRPARREHDDRHLRPGRTHLAREVAPVPVREHQVEQHEVEPRGPRAPAPPPATPRPPARTPPAPARWRTARRSRARPRRTARVASHPRL